MRRVDYVLCRCGSSYVYRSGRWRRRPLALLLLAPFRCHDCGRVVWRLRWARTHDRRS